MVSLGSAEFTLSANAEALIRAMDQSERKVKAATAQIAQSLGVSERAVTQAANKIAVEQDRVRKANEAATVGFSGFSRSAIGFAAAAGGVALGAAAVHQAMSKVSEETQKANQAIFALTATYRTSTAAFSAFAEAQADGTKRTVSEVQEAISAFGSLGNRYAITTEQIKELTKRSADLAAVKGITTVEAAKRLEAALRGEAESAEFLGLTLNSDYLKKFADMTAEQRRNWETLDPLTKAQIAYREVLRQTDPLLGTAAKRAREQAGASDTLATSMNNLAVAIGKNATPAMSGFAIQVANATDAVTALIEANRKLAEQHGLSTPFAADDPANYGRGNIQIGPDLGLPGSIPGPTPAQLDAASQGRAEYDRAVAARRARVQAELDEAKDALDKQVDLEIEAIDRERKAKEAWYDEERTRIEARRYYQLQDIETRRDATLKALEEQKQAGKDAIDAEIEAATRARDGEIKEAERKKEAALVQIDAEADAAKGLYDGLIRDAERARDAQLAEAERQRDGAIAAIEAEKQANADARRDADRLRADARRSEDRDRADRRQAEDQEREDAKAKRLAAVNSEHEQAQAAFASEIKRINDRKEASLRAIEDEADAARRASELHSRELEDQHNAVMRGLDDEADAARRAHDDALRAISEQKQVEDDRHRAVMEGLDAEEKQRLAAIDAELGLLDAADNADQQAARDLSLQNAVVNARLGVKRAESTGNYAEILKARQELADAEQAIVQEGVKRDRDAARAALLAKKDALKEEIDARRKAEDDANRLREREIDDSRDAADEILDAQLRAIDDRKDAERDLYESAKRLREDELAATLDALDRRKRAVDDEADHALGRVKERQDAEEQSHQRDVERINRRYELAKRSIDREREDEDRALADRRESEDRTLADTRMAEDRALEDRQKAVQAQFEAEREAVRDHYENPDSGVIPTLKRKSEEIAAEHRARRENAERELSAERAAIEEHYDGIGGVIPLLKKKSEDFEREYTRRLAAARSAFEEERKAAELVYTNPEKTGLLDLLAKARTDEFNKLEQSKTDWENWKKKLHQEIEQAGKDLDAFIKKLDEMGIGFVKIPGTDKPPGSGGGDPGGNQAYAPVVRNASADSYWTSGGTHGGHPAADIFASKGEPIYAPIGGVSRPATYPLGGNTTMLDGDDGRSYYFAHGNRPFEGGRVKKGERIGEVGNTGNASGTAPHLHFAISSQGRGLFGELNGSGDVNGDASWWTTGASMGANDRDAGTETEITLFGRKVRIRLKNGVITGDVGKWVKKGLEKGNLPDEWGIAIAMMAAAESGERNSDGTVKVGTGNPRARNPEGVNVNGRKEHAQGLMQMLPSTFKSYRVDDDDNILNPVDNVAAAGLYIKTRYGSPWGTHYWDHGRFDWRGVPGYRHGGMISEPTLLVGMRSGPYAFAGEAGPERILSPESTRAHGQADTATSVHMDFRGAQIYDGDRFQKRVVAVLRDADSRGQIKLGRR